MATSGFMMSKILDNDIYVRVWSDNDRAELVPLIQRYIEEACPDMIPSESNGNMFFDCAGPGSGVALVKNQIVGFTLLTPVNHVQTKVRMVHSVGTYVLPEFRRRGIAEQLRRRAMKAARQAGFDGIQGFTYTKDNSKSIEKLGGRVVGVVMETPLED